MLWKLPIVFKDKLLLFQTYFNNELRPVQRMFPFLSVLLFVVLSIVHCQDPRKRFVLDPAQLQKDDIVCNTKSCFKRSWTQEDMGPFWANRGKKDPKYLQEKLLVDEPFFICLRKDLRNEPFYNSRGKKPLYWNPHKNSIDDSDNDNGKSRREA
ncbi:uncharacterized protein LOC109541070 [Dendroctonus ponderosae]|uniref:uncharacterized protein LOC109541070 n=1 Tax=Dendroctonus ponderosae TaxID=77166 RepID=UPI0020353EF3|nr:uncharacterized protein LOC109541070 [Dendroctonus ponderosae]KAH1030076.1 hypothetical protein HUJ05_003207 [Dendroctonus ponderosae]